MKVITRNVNSAFHEMMWKMRILGEQEESRNGPVIVLPEPVQLEILDPRCRVLFDPVRKCNPFFHVMETVWMFAGENQVSWLAQFNKRIAEFADNGVLRGAYGMRWAQYGQIGETIRLLRREPTTRQAVISMWDPGMDGPWIESKDRPCNTHIYFRMRKEKLNMTVCNRSNDLVWGMLGANIVHMTYLHELIAMGAGLPVGRYTVFSNNVHFYTDLYPNGDEIWNHYVNHDRYGILKPYQMNDNWVDILDDCKKLVDGNTLDFRSSWMIDVAYPIYKAWFSRRGADKIAAEDWNYACTQWLQSSSS